MLNALTFLRMQHLNFVFIELKRLSTYPLYILLLSLGAFLLPLIYVEALIHKAVLPKFLFISFISISAFILWFIALQKEHITTFYYNRLFYLLIGIFIFSLSSIVWSDFSGTYQLESINFACLLLLAFTSMQISKTTHIQLILFSAVSGGALTALIAFLQVWGWNPFYYNITGFPAASFINKNHLANYIDLLIPVSLFLLVTSHGNKKKWILSISISLLFSYLIFSHTRASWISLLVTLSLILYLSYKYPWLQKQFQSVDSKYTLLIIFLSIALINSPGSTLNEENRFTQLYNSLGSTEDTSSTTSRMNAYKGAIEMIKDNPILGTGLGSFQIAFKPYNQNITQKGQANSIFIQLHNDPLQVFVELGIIGGLLAITFVLMILYKSYHSIDSYTRSPTTILHSTILLGILLSIIASITHSLLDFPLHLPASSFLLYLYIGSLMSINAKTKDISQNLKLFFYILIVTVSSFSFSFYSSFASASYHLNDAIKTLFSHHPKYQYQPLFKTNNENSCKAAKLKTDNALNTYSNDFHIHAWAYVIYVQCVKNQAEYLKLSHKVLGNNPYHKAALENVALIEFNNKNYSSAKHYYQILHYLYPLNSGYSLLLGHIAVKQKDYETAHKYYLKTLSLSPDNSVAPEMINKLDEKGYLKNLLNKHFIQ